MVYSHAHTIHVWYIYLHLVDVYGKYVGRYTIHGSYGIFFEKFGHISWIGNNDNILGCQFPLPTVGNEGFVCCPSPGRLKLPCDMGGAMNESTGMMYFPTK